MGNGLGSTDCWPFMLQGGEAPPAYCQNEGPTCACLSILISAVVHVRIVNHLRVNRCMDVLCLAVFWVWVCASLRLHKFRRDTCWNPSTGQQSSYAGVHATLGGWRFTNSMALKTALHSPMPLLDPLNHCLTVKWSGPLSWQTSSWRAIIGLRSLRVYHQIKWNNFFPKVKPMASWQTTTEIDELYLANLWAWLIPIYVFGMVHQSKNVKSFGKSDICI